MGLSGWGLHPLSPPTKSPKLSRDEGMGKGGVRAFGAGVGLGQVPPEDG